MGLDNGVGWDIIDWLKRMDELVGGWEVLEWAGVGMGYVLPLVGFA